MAQQASAALVNADVITLDTKMPSASAVLVQHGRIALVGESRQILEQVRGEEVVDLGGLTLVPGLVESHMHPSGLATALLEVDLRPGRVNCVQDILKAVRQRTEKEPPGTWIRARGYDDTKLKERRHITRDELDSVSSLHPVYVRRTCGHMGVANSMALRVSGVTQHTQDPPGGRIERSAEAGELTGLLLEQAQRLLSIPAYTEEQYVSGLEKALSVIGGWGLTTIHDMGVGRTVLGAYTRLLEKRRLTARVRVWLSAERADVLDDAMGLASGEGCDMLKIMGMKFMLDGSVGGRSAALAQPYAGDAHNRGILYMNEEELAPRVLKCLRNGLRVGVHAIGERAIEVCIRAFESASDVIPLNTLRNMRNRIEHCALPTAEQVLRMKRLGLVAASSTGFIHELGDSYIQNLGSRVARAYPMSTFLQYGIAAPGSSDCPVCNGNPFLGMGGAVTRKTQSGAIWDNSQNISALEALSAYTTLGAYSALEEHSYGAIKKGMLGDMTLLSHNPLRAEPDAIKHIRAEMTFVGGVKVFDSSLGRPEW